MRKILLIGANGQLGKTLLGKAPTSPESQLFHCDRHQLDLTTERGIELIRETLPDTLVNCSAYTQVDKAESEPEQADEVNHLAVSKLATVCADINCRLIHISTDFVFEGTQPLPYQPKDITAPLSVYGATKKQGEDAIKSTSELRSIILRTSWLYSVFSNNFVKTMLRLFAERPSLNVVYDQIGSPTWTNDLADAIWLLAARKDIGGIFHYSNAGVASWYDFAVAIQEEALELGLTDGKCKIRPILSKDYPLPAKRPHYSVLDCQTLEEALGIERPHWRVSLRNMLKELKQRD